MANKLEKEQLVYFKHNMVVNRLFKWPTLTVIRRILSDINYALTIIFNAFLHDVQVDKVVNVFIYYKEINLNSTFILTYT